MAACYKLLADGTAVRRWLFAVAFAIVDPFRSIYSLCWLNATLLRENHMDDEDQRSGSKLVKRGKTGDLLATFSIKFEGARTL